MRLSAGRSNSISSRGRGGKSSSHTRLSPAERLKVVVSCFIAGRRARTTRRKRKIKKKFSNNTRLSS